MDARFRFRPRRDLSQRAAEIFVVEGARLCEDMGEANASAAWETLLNEWAQAAADMRAAREGVSGSIMATARLLTRVQCEALVCVRDAAAAGRSVADVARERGIKGVGSAVRKLRAKGLLTGNGPETRAVDDLDLWQALMEAPPSPNLREARAWILGLVEQHRKAFAALQEEGRRCLRRHQEAEQAARGPAQAVGGRGGPVGIVRPAPNARVAARLASTEPGRDYLSRWQLLTPAEYRDCCLGLLPPSRALRMQRILDRRDDTDPPVDWAAVERELDETEPAP